VPCAGVPGRLETSGIVNGYTRGLRARAVYDKDDGRQRAAESVICAVGERWPRGG
jgi:hypothetical protein